MRASSILVAAAVLSVGILSSLGCNGNAPMDSVEEAKLVQAQNAAMERNHALNQEKKPGGHKSAKRSASSASPEAQRKAN